MRASVRRFRGLEIAGFVAMGIAVGLVARGRADLRDAYAAGAHAGVKALINCTVPHVFAPNTPALASEVNANFAAILACIDALDERTQFFSVASGDLNALSGPHLLIDGANVHVRSGSGDTDDGGGALTGLGNLIVGYNEDLVGNATRTGSHNVIVGRDHEYTSYGGLVVGRVNTIGGEYSSVCGGSGNQANGAYSSVCGGSGNQANGTDSSVSGGVTNIVHAPSSSISGGNTNTINGSAPGGSILGGFLNAINGCGSCSIVGGRNNMTGGNFSVVVGRENAPDCAFLDVCNN